MPGIWASLTSHNSIPRPIDGVFRIGFVITRRPEITALLTTFPRATMVILIMGVAHTKALVLDLTPPAASKRHKRRIATDPLLTTRCLHQRRLGIATESAARQQSAWLPCGCMSSPLLVSLASIPWLPSALALQVHHAEERSILFGHLELPP